MGRKLNVSTPTVINTELVPLDESFYLEAIGQTEQWYYDNTNQFQPNRTVTPLTLVPHVSAYDKDAQRTYTPLFQIVRWFEQAYDATQGEYVETEITNQTDSPTAEYVKLTNNNLLVKKNVPYSHAITIRCEATYVDPRDNGITYTTEERVLLVTNRDAKIVYPTLDVLCPSAQSYNPLIDASSEFSMQAKADYSAVVDSDVAEYRVDKGGTEEIVPQNETEVVTSAPFLDLRYGNVEQENQQFMYRATGGGGLTGIDGNVAYVNKIKGNTVKFNQITQNGNFANGTTGWVVEGTATVSNNVCIYTCDRSAGFFYQNVPLVSGHKYYQHVDLKKTTASANIMVYFIASGSDTGVITEETTNWQTVTRIATANATVVGKTVVSDRRNSGWDSVQIRNFMLFDLTAMGIDNLTTVAQVEQWLAQNIGLKSYYPYNEGELIPVKMSAIKSVGFNLWDEEWEVGTLDQTNGTKRIDDNCLRSKWFIPVSPSTTYCSYCASANKGVVVFFYDISKNFIDYTMDAEFTYNFTTPSNCHYIMFRTFYSYGGGPYKNDICINLSDEARNGTYEAHWEFNRSLPVTQLTGKQVGGTNASVVIFPNGMQRVGNVFDEIKVEGGQIKAVKRFERVNLGNLTWTKYINYHAFNSRAISDALNRGMGARSNMICPIYTQVAAAGIGNLSTDKTFCFDMNSTQLDIRDASFDSATETEFKTAMNGVYLVYELATPLTYIIDNMPKGIFEWYGISNNAEVLVENLPWYKSGQHTDTLVVDAMYGEDIRVVLRAKDSHGALIPPKVHRNIHWRIPDIDSNVVSENGSSVRGIPMDMTFDTIVNVNGTVLDDNTKKNHLRFNWKTRRSQPANSPEVDKGWGAKKILTSTELQNSYQANMATTIVFPYVYLAGAYESVSLVNDPVTYNGEPVFDRPVE